MQKQIFMLTFEILSDLRTNIVRLAVLGGVRATVRPSIADVRSLS